MSSFRQGTLAPLLTLAALLTPASEAPQSTAAGMMGRIEGAQFPNRQEFDPYTIAEILKKNRVPGASVAVIKDYSIHGAKGCSGARNRSAGFSCV